MRLSRPLYECLPLLYVAIGALGDLDRAISTRRVARSIIAFGIGLLAASRRAHRVFACAMIMRALSREYTGRDHRSAVDAERVAPRRSRHSGRDHAGAYSRVSSLVLVGSRARRCRA